MASSNVESQLAVFYRLPCHSDTRVQTNATFSRVFTALPGSLALVISIHIAVQEMTVFVSRTNVASLRALESALDQRPSRGKKWVEPSGSITEDGHGVWFAHADSSLRAEI